VPFPLVSICIPTFDRLGYLREAVASARAQTLRDVEIVIGDDGESAALRAWCLAQSAEDSRVRYAKTPGRLRLAGNWNFLAGLAVAEYSTFIGDDDRLHPTFAQRLVEGADRCGADVVFSNQCIIDGAGELLPAETTATTKRYGRDSLTAGLVENAHSLVWANSVPMSASIVRTTIVRRLGFKTDMNTPELELFARMAVEGARFAFVDDYLADYRTHAMSETSAGLMVDRLAEHLHAIAVPTEAEAEKRTFLRSLLVAGVGVRLRRGDVEGARALRANPYYPRLALDPRPWAQSAILALPAPLVPLVHSFARALVEIVRARRNRQKGDAHQR
jgi:glycosyltransferase involved in cell wall biosynthesis